MKIRNTFYKNRSPPAPAHARRPTALLGRRPNCSGELKSPRVSHSPGTERGKGLLLNRHVEHATLLARWDRAEQCGQLRRPPRKCPWHPSTPTLRQNKKSEKQPLYVSRCPVGGGPLLGETGPQMSQGEPSSLRLVAAQGGGGGKKKRNSSVHSKRNVGSTWALGISCKLLQQIAKKWRWIFCS